MGKTIADWHKEYFPFVLRRCRQMLRNTQDAEDAAQEVFIRLLKAEKRGMDLDETTNKGNLLWTYATNVCISRISQIEEIKRKHGNNVSFFEEGIPATGNDFERLDAKILLQSIFEQESEETRLYCYMYFYDRMKLKEIAKTVGKSKSWVHKKIEQFKRDTRRKLEESMK